MDMYIVSDMVQDGEASLAFRQPAVYDILWSDRLQERAGHSIRMYILSDMVQEGVVWPLQPVYDMV
jgi:hypothetical protein